MPIIDSSRDQFKFDVTVTIPVPIVLPTLPELKVALSLNSVIAKIIAAVQWFNNLIGKLIAWVYKMVALVKRLLASIPEVSVRVRLRTAPFTIAPLPFDLTIGPLFGPITLP